MTANPNKPGAAPSLIRTLSEILLISILIIGLPLTAHGDMYKWVDKDGVTHYTQTPPSGRDSEVMAPPDRPAETPEQAQARTRSITGHVNKHLKNQAQQEKDEQKSAAVKARKQKNCEIARRNLQILARPTNRVRQRKDGQLLGVSEAERDQLLKQQQTNVDKYCSDA